MKSFTELAAWQCGMKLVKEVYLITQGFPSDERYEMRCQIRKASTSILANIAEGFSRRSPSDKAHKYTIARGECSEVHAFLLMSIELGFLSKENAQYAVDLAMETGKIITGLIQAHTYNSAEDCFALPPTPTPTP